MSHVRLPKVPLRRWILDAISAFSVPAAFVVGCLTAYFT